MSQSLPPIPVKVPISDQQSLICNIDWLKWFDLLKRTVESSGGGAPSIKFKDLDFSGGSNITSIQIRNHYDLQNLNAFDDHLLYLLLAGRTGGQVYYGGLVSPDTLTMSSNASATKTKILWGSNSAYDELNTRLGIGTQSPSCSLEVISTGSTRLRIVSNTNAQTPQLSIINTSGSSGAASIYLSGAGSGDAYVAGRNTGFLHLGTSASEGGAITPNISINQSTRDVSIILGHLLFDTDNVRDIGASGATRPGNIYAGTLVRGPIVDATTGFRRNNTAPLGTYLRGTGTNFVESLILPNDLAFAGRPVFFEDGSANDDIFPFPIMGPQGQQGTQGLQGTPGLDGTDGEDGLTGIPGSIGATGMQGLRGSPGEDGLDGEDSRITGPSGIQGIQGIMGPPGEDGASVLDEFIPEYINKLNYFYLPGRPGGQIGYGGINASENLTLGSTANSTKGFIYLGASSGYDETNTYLGIGTAAPTSFLHLYKDRTAGSNAISAYNYSGIAATTPFIWDLNTARGSSSSPSQVASGDLLGKYGFSGYVAGATNAFRVGAGITVRCDGTPGTFTPSRIGFTTATSSATDVERMRIDSSGNVGIGVTPTDRLEIDGGNFIIASDNTYDIGATGATRPRTAYLGTSVSTPKVQGGEGSGNNLTLTSTTHATKGKIYLGSVSNYDEVNGQLYIYSNIISSIPLSVDVDGTSNNTFTAYNAFTLGPNFNLRYSKGTLASPTTVASGDIIGEFQFLGYNGTSFNACAALIATIDGTVSSSQVPGRLVFSTAPTGSLGVSEKMRITPNGRVGIGTAGDPTTSSLLELKSTTGALLLTRMTSTQRDALTAVNGMLIYNSTTDKFQGYEAGAWTNLI